MNLDRLVEFLNQLKKRKDISYYSEAETKQAIILRLLSLLDWDVFNSDEVNPEYGVGERRVDYALRIFSAAKVFIEAKKVGESLALNEEQLVMYATIESVRLAVLTNGITWWLYLPLVEGSWEQKKFYTIDIIEQEPSQAAEKFGEFLSRSMTVSGDAIKRAEAVLKDRNKDLVIARSLPLAWNRLVQGPDEFLIELLRESTEKLCGYEIETDTVIRFVEDNQQALIIGVEASPVSSRIRRAKRAKKQAPTPIVEPPSNGKTRTRNILKVTINWQKVGKSQPSEEFVDGKPTDVFVQVLDRIARQVGGKYRELLDFRVTRGMLLSKERTKYHVHQVQGLYVLTYNTTLEKAEILRQVAQKFDLPTGFIQVDVVNRR